MLSSLKLTSAAIFSLAIIGIASLSSASSAYAAGCLQPEQSRYSLVESDDNDDALAANAAGFACDNESNILSYAAPAETVFSTGIFAAEPQTRTPSRPVLDDSPRESLVESD